MANIDTPIWPIEGVALESVDPAVAGSLADVVLEVHNTLGAGGNHVPLFTGDVYYVDAAQSDDSGDGTSPETAKKTIGAGIGLLSAGDALAIKAGTYTETGLDLDVNACEMWFEIGAIIDPVSGTALTVSGDYCWLKGPHEITPAAGAIGLLVSGDSCIVEDSKVLQGATGIQVTGAGAVLNKCAVGFQTTTSYDLQGTQGRLYRCKTVGNGATIGYKISNGADTGVLEECTSSGHTTAGFYIDTGSQDWTLLNCSSGGNDGRWVDVDHGSVWSGFTFENEVYATQTMNGGTTYNLWQVTGAVRITDIFGVVETQIENTASSLHLEVFSAGGSADLTQAPGTNIQAAVVGSLLVKNEDATNNISLASAATPAVLESSNWRSPKVPADIVADYDQTTYIRAVLSVLLSTGVIHWHCHWEPLSDDGFVEGA